MRIGKWMLMGAALALGGACNVNPNQEYADALPQQDGLSLQITGAASEAATSLNTPNQGRVITGDDIGFVNSGLTSVPEFLQDARAGISELNEGVKNILDKVQDVVTSGDGKAISSDVREYGPKDIGNVTVRLFVKKFDATHFGWRIDAKPLGGDDSTYVIVMGGGIAKNPDPHRGRGFVGIDLDNWKSVDSTFTGEGKLLCGFAHVGNSKTLAYALKNFTPSTSTHDPVTAAFVGHRLDPTGESAVRLAGFFNLDGTATSAKEFVRLRAHWIPGTGGRADLLAVGGDIPAGTLYWGASCWDVSETETYKILVQCTGSTAGSTSSASCTVLSQTGNKATCASALGPDPETAQNVPTGDVNAVTPESSSPATPPTPPSGVSDGTGSAPNP